MIILWAIFTLATPDTLFWTQVKGIGLFLGLVADHLILASMIL